jgi:hypothetical protein
MPQTLTEWWTQLDTETRRLAKSYGVDYPERFTPDTNTDLETDDNPGPWIVINKMACLGASIEGNLSVGMGIKARLERVEKQLGSQIPDSSHYVPNIVDEQSLLLAIVYYRSQCRFQEVVSPITLIQNGMPMFGPGVEQNKPQVATEAQYLRRAIKNYCARNPAIATQAHAKFIELFPEATNVAADLFKPKTLTEQYKNHILSLVETLSQEIKADSYEEGRSAILSKIDPIKVELQKIQTMLNSLYLSKKMEAFVTNASTMEEMTFDNFRATLAPAGRQLTDEQIAEAQALWDQAKEHAAANKTAGSRVIEGTIQLAGAISDSTVGRVVSRGISAVANSTIGSFMARIITPVRELATAAAGKTAVALGVSEQDRFKAFKQHFNTKIATHIEEQSERLAAASSDMKKEDLKAASAEDIHALAMMNHELMIEIRALKSTLDIYVAQIKNDPIIKFSKAPFFEWVTKQMAGFKWMRALLYDNLHYLDIAEEFKQELSALEEKEGATLDDLRNLQSSMARKTDEIKTSSMYLLLNEERARAHEQLSELTKEPESHSTTSLTTGPGAPSTTVGENGPQEAKDEDEDEDEGDGETRPPAPR